MYIKWISSHRYYDKFIKTNSEWLKKSFSIPIAATKAIPMKVEHRDFPSSSTAGLSESLTKSFTDLSERQKRRRIEEVRAEHSADTLLFAAKMNMSASGNRDIAKILSYLTQHPEDASKIRAFCEGNTLRHNINTLRKRPWQRC